METKVSVQGREAYFCPCSGWKAEACRNGGFSPPLLFSTQLAVVTHTVIGGLSDSDELTVTVVEVSTFPLKHWPQE